MNFIVRPLPVSEFSHLFGKGDEELESLGARAYLADVEPGYPCRVSLRDASPGERLILVNYFHQAAASPYRSCHAIFVIDGAQEITPIMNDVPEYLAARHLAVRAYDNDHMMTAALLIDAKDAADCLKELLSEPENEYLHVHNAARGCYLARIDKVF